MSRLQMIEILAVVGGLALLGGCIEWPELYERAGFCGNGGLDRGEECDDGNAQSGDGCSAGCRRELSAGGAHTCVVLDAERVRCWGRGSSGQLGQGSSVTMGDDEPGLSQGSHVGGKARQVVAGGEHTCALMETGTVRCWGHGEVGQLGYGNTSDIGDDEAPWSAGDVDVADVADRGTRVTQLAAGRFHSCALMDTGRVRCWGDGSSGRLGYGNTSNVGDVDAPRSAGDVDVADPGIRVIQVVAGAAHTCALMETGKVRCWGSGLHGRLGYGDTANATDKNVGNNELPSSKGDVDIADRGTRVIQLAAGQRHTCALMDTGTVRCWGDNGNGQLGYGRFRTIGDDEPPSSAGDVDVAGSGSRVIQVVTGAFHTCALMDTGAVRCWGLGESGQLGYGDTAKIGNDEVPSSVGEVVVAAPGVRVIQLAAGDNHTCALMETGRVRCWGDGSSGQLGYGSTANIGDDESPSSAGDVDVGVRVVQLTAGGRHTCALLDTGTVRCWGSGEHGRLGYGDTTTLGDDEPPRVEDIFRDDAVVQVVAGGEHSCLLRETGDVYCWGAGGHGQHGHGHTLAIGDDEALAFVDKVRVGGGVQQITAGMAHTCGLLDTGRVRCWGDGAYGRLGRGTTENIGDDETPDEAETVDLGGEPVQIQAGAEHTCALLDTGAIRCWGSNEHGQLGLGLSRERSVGDGESPATAGEVRVGGAVQQMVTGGFHTCALLESGEVRCWGRNDAGQLGLASTETVGDDEQPGDKPAVELGIRPGERVVQLSAGDEHTCALMDTGAVRCWGSGRDGRLGYGDVEAIGDDENPASAGDVALAGAAVGISAGAAHTCAMLEGGAIVCWGAGQDGRLGHGSVETVGDDETPAMVGPVPGR